MNRHLPIKPHFIILCLFSILFLSIGCARNVKTPQGALDTPEHHLNSGKILVEQGDVDRALGEFRRAVELDPKFAAAHREAGLAYGQKSEFKKAFAAMKSAKKYSGNAGEKAQAHVGFLRLYTRQADRNWLPHAENEFGRAIGYNRDLADAYYFMGVAYHQAGKYSQAEKNS